MTIYLHHLRVLKACASQGRGDVEGRPESNGQHDGWPLGGEAQDLRDHHGSPQNVTGGFMDLHGEMKRPRTSLKSCCEIHGDAMVILTKTYGDVMGSDKNLDLTSRKFI
jgi:hypothetical protein